MPRDAKSKSYACSGPLRTARIPERRLLLRQHLYVAVEAALDLALARVDLALVAGDEDVFALGQRQGREGADRLADHVAAGRQHAEGGPGEGLAAGRADELQGHGAGPVVQRRVRDLAGLDTEVGPHDGVR